MGGSQDTFKVCDLDLNEGTECGKPYQVLYYYNKYSGRCQQFVYKGCGGNGNKFDSEAICDAFCIVQGDARPSGERPSRPEGSSVTDEEIPE